MTSTVQRPSDDRLPEERGFEEHGPEAGDSTAAAGAALLAGGAIAGMDIAGMSIAGQVSADQTGEGPSSGAGEDDGPRSARHRPVLSFVRRSGRLDKRLQKAWDAYADSYLLPLNDGENSLSVSDDLLFNDATIERYWGIPVRSWSRWGQDRARTSWRRPLPTRNSISSLWRFMIRASHIRCCLQASRGSTIYASDS